MDIQKTIAVLEALASGCSPSTGEMLATESVLSERDVIRALQIAIDTLKQEKGLNKKEKNEPWRVVDFFKKERFNTLSEEAINNLKQQINQLGIVKKENLSDYIRRARLNYPRSHEAWSDREKALLWEALKFTNDLELLSKCFQRGMGAIESCGQHLIYENQNNL